MGFTERKGFDTDSTTGIGGVNKKTRKQNPKSIEGFYIGSKDVPSKMSKTGLCKLHVLQTKTGSVGVWGKTDMDNKLTGAVVGAMTRITFIGMKEIAGKNPMYRYKVEQDEGNAIEVAGMDDNSSEESDDTTTEYNSDDDGQVTDSTETEEFSDEAPEDDPEEEEAPVDEAPPVQAARPAKKATATAPTPAAQKKVQDILARRRTTAA